MSQVVEVPQPVPGRYDCGFRMQFEPNLSGGLVVISLCTGEGEYTEYKRLRMSFEDFKERVAFIVELTGRQRKWEEHGSGRVSATFPSSGS